MEIVFNPPVWVLLVCGGIAVIGIPSVLLKKSKTWQKVLVLSVIAIAIACLLFFFYRKTHLLVDDKGIKTDMYGSVTIPWDKLTHAEIVLSIGASAYNPVMKMNGVGLGVLQYGWYKLKNGETAYIYMEQKEKGIVLKTAEKTYLFAVKQIDALIGAIRVYKPFPQGAQ